MNNEDERIKHWKEQILQMEVERRRRGDGALPFEREVVQLLQRERAVVRKYSQAWRLAWQRLGARFSNRLYYVVHGRGRPQVDTELRQLVEVQFYSTGKLTATEMRQIHRQGIVQRGLDGKPEAVGPSQRECRLAMAGIAMLISVLAPSLVHLLADPFWLPTHFGPAMLLGASTGFCSRQLYLLYWGRQQLARKLTYLWPAFRYVGKV